MTIREKREVLNIIRKALITYWLANSQSADRIIFHSSKPRLWFELGSREYEVTITKTGENLRKLQEG